MTTTTVYVYEVSVPRRKSVQPEQWLDLTEKGRMVDAIGCGARIDGIEEIGSDGKTTAVSSYKPYLPSHEKAKRSRH